jgi:phenylalanyl-tRNA synthetase beta chain
LKVLLSWIREFAPVEGDPATLGEAMSDLGMAVESIDLLGRGLDGVVVARVLGLRAHPDADRIQLVDVDAGDGEALQICCGAFNFAVGDLVPLATIGTTMPNGLTIERRKLRGEWSNGMLCSGAELGLGDDHAGILVLSDGLRPGTDLKEALGVADDVLYDLEVNPNRPDAMSVAGVARDLASRLGVPFAIPVPAVVEAAASITGQASVDIVDPDLCGRFHVRLLDGVSVGPSPQWIASRLTALGMRPVNSVVDASNYVMLELGQPNHAYDLAKVPGGALRVRWARSGERILTLDGVERLLDADDGVIADRDDVAIGIAGVMGGASTEISEATSGVLLEMAWWEPLAVARSSKRLGLRSEASARFERGTDPEIVDLASRRFAELLAPSGVRLLAGEVDARGDLPAPAVVRVRTARVNGVLGTTLTTADVRAQLEPIEFRCEHGDAADVLDVHVPSFRPDTTTETDVIEEVARHYGYGNIPRTVPASFRIGRLTDRQTDRRALRQVLVGLGVDEAMPLPFLAPGDLEAASVESRAVTLTNPLVAEESVLRTSLRPGLLNAVAYNRSHRNEGVRLFEIGKVFLPCRPGEVLPDEREAVGVILDGCEAGEAVEVWRVVAESLGVPGVRLEQVPAPGLHPGRSAELVAGDEVIGVLGEVDPAVLERLELDRAGIEGRVAVVEADLDRLLALPHGERPYRRVSRFPSNDIDLAFEVDEHVPAAAVEQVIRDAAGELLAHAHLFDVFRGPSLPEGARSLAFNLRLQAPDRTLTDDEVGALRARVIAAVEAALPARLRG